MVQFKKTKSRYDYKAAMAGRRCEIDDVFTGVTYGPFLCGLVDDALPRVRVASERIQRKYQGSDNSKISDLEKMKRLIEILVEVGGLLGWENILDANDKPVPFTVENAISFFSQHDIDEETGKPIMTHEWLYHKVANFCSNLINFQPVDQKGLPEKN
ncbi:hypothetical protein SAMN05518849_11685 [Sphingobium sp. AP50]|nr:hypothetical protein SAMN05518849_11685 [Sphingobium sp. AP50]